MRSPDEDGLLDRGPLDLGVTNAFRMLVLFAAAFWLAACAGTARAATAPGQTGTASWYGADFHGRKTASGERFDAHELSVAHRTLPMNSLVEITNLSNGKKVVARVNDRGPFTKGRLVDVSRATAEALDFVRKGATQVRVRYLGPAGRHRGLTPLSRDDDQSSDRLTAISAPKPAGSPPKRTFFRPLRGTGDTRIAER
jgi:rare lipoprotein A (peptidoglycan hydrolase)